MIGRLATLALLGSAVSIGCRRNARERAAISAELAARSPVVPSELPPGGTDTSAASDASVSDGGTVPPRARCPVRAVPPSCVMQGIPAQDSPSVAWNGGEWGLAWSEEVAGIPTVYFARVGPDGTRRGGATRVSETGYRGNSPDLLWTGDRWAYVFSGGASRTDEIWFALLDAHGALVSRPHRITGRDRSDYAPSLASDGRNLIVTWAARWEEHRWGVFAMRLDRWGSQLELPLLLSERRERVSTPSALWNGFAWAAAWLVSRNEAIGVDMSRFEARLETTRGPARRVTPGPLGGSDVSGRYNFAWDGSRYGLVWDEVRDGAPHVFFDTVSRVLNPTRHEVMLSAPGDPASAPAIVTLAPNAFMVAWETEVSEQRHVQIATIDAEGRRLGDPIEVQNHDGRASLPALALADDVAGLVTLGMNGIMFHRVMLGPCLR